MQPGGRRLVHDEGFEGDAKQLRSKLCKSFAFDDPLIMAKILVTCARSGNELLGNAVLREMEIRERQESDVDYLPNFLVKILIYMAKERCVLSSAMFATYYAEHLLSFAGGLRRVPDALASLLELWKHLGCGCWKCNRFLMRTLRAQGVSYFSN